MRGILISTPIQAFLCVCILSTLLIQAYMSELMRGILISTLNTSIYERAYERDSHKHAEYKHICMSVLMRGILINTLIQAYMSVLMRGILLSTLIQAYMSVLMRHQNKGFS